MNAAESLPATPSLSDQAVTAGIRSVRELRRASPCRWHERRTHTIALFERIPLAPTVERDLREGRFAQRLPAFS